MSTTEFVYVKLVYIAFIFESIKETNYGIMNDYFLITKSLLYRIIPGEEFLGNEERGSDSRSFKDGERDLE